jgi:hypothetical protein
VKQELMRFLNMRIILIANKKRCEVFFPCSEKPLMILKLLPLSALVDAQLWQIAINSGK